MITIEHVDGVGRNANYHIRKDGKRVATLTRYGNYGWQLYSANYGIPLASYRSIELARAGVPSVEYPDAQSVYETLCKKAAEHRRAYKEKHHAHDLARLARELIAGSNSAREEIENLLNEIETWIADRTDTPKNAQAKADQHFEATGRRIYVYSNDPPRYPELPEPK